MTTKADLQARSPDFRARALESAAVFYTSGSSGVPCPIVFSREELRTAALTAAFGATVSGQVCVGDEVLVAHGTRVGLSNTCMAAAAALVGARVTVVAQPAPERLLALLCHGIARTTVAYLYPSYLAHLLRVMTRDDLARLDHLRCIAVGGEIVTDGLIRRARSVLGPKVRFVQGYGMTETWPASGTVCEAGHLHFEPTRAVVEVKALDSNRHAGPGELGTLVVTPLAPFRLATPILRYDTEDIVQVPSTVPICSMAGTPATSTPLGRVGFSIRLRDRWITPRAILEIVDDDPNVPLPSRVSYRRRGQHIDVDVGASRADSDDRDRLASALESAGIPLGDLVLHVGPFDNPHGLYPWRGDLWEPELSGNFRPDADP